jgi:hypothetical protein
LRQHSFQFRQILFSTEILAAKPEKKPLSEEKSSVTIQKVGAVAATTIKPIIVPPPEPPKVVKRQPRIKYSKHVNPATSYFQTQTSQQASIISQINIPAPQQPKFVLTTPEVKQEGELSLKSPLIIQQVEYDASASNTSQSADFSNAIIDGIDYSGIDDIELTDDVHVSFTDSISQSERSDDGQTTLHIHTIDEQKYQVLVNSSGHNRCSGANSSQEEGEGEGEAEGSVGDDDSESRPHACCHCGKRYRWKSTLRRHESVECGGKEAAHQCPYCTYKAKQRGNLGVHIRKHHPEMPQVGRDRRISRKLTGNSGLRTGAHFWSQKNDKAPSSRC